LSLAFIFRIFSGVCIEGYDHNNRPYCSHRSPKEYISAGEEGEELWGTSTTTTGSPPWRS
jgi:hypothetical protein